MTPVALAERLAVMRGRGLDERAQPHHNDQRSDARKGAYVPRHTQLRVLAARVIQVTVVAQLLPVGADDVRGLTGIRRDQVTGSYRAGKVARFGQVCTVLTHRREDGVSSGRGSRPGSDGAVGGFEGERVFGVDAANFGPGDLNGANHIAQGHTGDGHAHFGAPEGGPREQGNKPEDGHQLQGFDPTALNSGDNERNCAGGEDDYRKYAPESRVQGEVWRHATMFPRADHFQGERRNS